MENSTRFRHCIESHQSATNRQQPLSVAMILLLMTRNQFFLTSAGGDACDETGAKFQNCGFPFNYLTTSCVYLNGLGVFSICSL